jgi:hypothetical protein
MEVIFVNAPLEGLDCCVNENTSLAAMAPTFASMEENVSLELKMFMETSNIIVTVVKLPMMERATLENSVRQMLWMSVVLPPSMAMCFVPMVER